MTVYIVYGYDRYYPPDYGVIAVYKQKKDAKELAKKLREQGSEKIQEGDDSFPECVRGGYAGLYEHIKIKEENMR